MTRSKTTKNSDSLKSYTFYHTYFIAQYYNKLNEYYKFKDFNLINQNYFIDISLIYFVPFHNL